MKRIASIIIFLWITSPLNADTEAGINLYNTERFAEAISEFFPEASTGNAEAQYYLGLMSAYGRGVDQSLEKAVQIFTKAAEAGHVPSQIQIAKMHSNGQGVERSYDNAIYWFDIAAKSGNALYVDEAVRWRDELSALLSEAKAHLQINTNRFPNRV